MAGRGPPRGNPGGCPKPGPSRPGMTRTQMLRTAQNTAVVQRDAPAEQARRGPCPARARTGLARVGPPPPDPKKIDFARPGMTKAMQMRQKAAAERVQRAEAQHQKPDTSRRPRRTPAPVGGDARLQRQRSIVSARRSPEDQVRVLEEAIARGHVVTDRGGMERTGAIPKRPMPGPSGVPRSTKPLAAATPIPNDTKELARLMNAEVVQAVPISDGPVDKIIIDPGVVSGDRSTIVCIASPDGTSADATAAGPSDVANKSIQAISQTLDEQDAVESAAVQGKLEELQNARREFVIAVANVGGNAVNIHDDSGDSILNISDINDGLDYIPSPPKPRAVYNLPDVTHEMFQVEYGLDHPDIVAARKFSQTQQARMDARAAERRREQMFEKELTKQVRDLDFGVPLEQDIQQSEISWEEDEHGNVMPCASRIKASMPPIPRKTDACPDQCGASPDEIERFFDIQNYPPAAGTPRAPPGREGLHRDLWELDDPWYFEQQRSEGTPLMRFDTTC